MEAVLNFGRGCQKWLQSCNGEWVGGGERGGGGDRRRLAPLITFIGGGVRGGGGGEVEVALQLFAFHIHVVLFLVPLSPFSILLWRPLSI
jgi:hypothetical protein